MKRTFISLLFSFLFTFSFSILSNAQEIKCLDCHENMVAKSVHDKVIKCGDCHNDIKSEDHSEIKAKKVECKRCHAAFDVQMQNDVHRKLLKMPEGKAPNCKKCHGTHSIVSPSSISDKNKSICGKCHTNNILIVPYHTESNLVESCNKCHGEKNHKQELEKSVHKNLTCSNCHSYVIKNLVKHQQLPKDFIKADCYVCHTTIAEEHKESIHGLSLTQGINEAAQCWDCHGSHDVNFVKDKNSKVYPTHLVKTCGNCHDDTAFIKKYELSVYQPGKMYSASVHGKLVMDGSKNAATCVTCHGKHDIKNRVQVGSMISSINLPNTCENCHKKETEEYKGSIHWIAVKKGIRSAPSCNDCHSEHSIKSINTANKRDEVKKIQDNTCLLCHQNLLLSQRYGLENTNANNYQDSYHGLAVSHGDKKAAMCVDCHNVHKILPKDHAESSVNKNNIVTTCRKCHAKATETFANSYSHTTQVNSAANIENIVQVIYFWLIVIVIGGMFLHNLIILIHELRVRYNKSKNEIQIPRFTSNELFQHTVLLISFIVLALTGFQLKYPNSFYGNIMYSIGFDEVVRQWVHRISAVIMITLSFYHVIYLIITSRGRYVLKGLIPRPSDITQAINTMLYYMNIKKKHPDYENYNYIKKAEYWALIWGTLIMGITGFVLWFPTIVGDWAPVWFIKVSEIVHFYEAILATLAIFIWHMFFVMFHPKEYPLSFTVINGKMSVVHYRHEHRSQYNKAILEYIEFKNGKRSAKKMGNFTKMFIKALEEKGVSMEEFVNSELETDRELKDFVDKHNLK